MNRVIHFAALAASVLALSATRALAHCFLDRSTPSAASVLYGSPPQVVLYFDNEFNPDATTVRVLNENGDVVSGNASASTDRRELVAPLMKVPPGQYFVKWRATSQDGDHTMGAYSFTVKAAP